MTVNACTGWDNTTCEGSEYCPPRCPRFIDDEGTAVLIRPYRPEQDDALRAMYEAIETSTMGLPPERRSVLEQWLRRLTTDGWNLLATVGDQVVGHVAVVPSDATDPEFVIFVHPEYQNRGIGTELLKHVIARTDDRDHNMLTLNVSREHHQAITVYEKVGFSATTVNQVEMQMALELEDGHVTAVQQSPAARNR